MPGVALPLAPSALYVTCGGTGSPANVQVAPLGFPTFTFSPPHAANAIAIMQMEVASRGFPVGSIIFSVFALLFISLVVLAILRHYLPLRTTPAFYLVPIFFALWLPSVIILLVPIDLASSAATDDENTRGIWLPERVILVAWRITYWLTFALTWYHAPLPSTFDHH